MNPVSNNSIRAALPNLLPQGAQEIQGGPSFMTFLLDSIKEANSMQQAAERAVEHLAPGGEGIAPAEVLTAVQKAEIAFRTMVQIGDKMVQAYQEVQNIRI